MEIEWTLITLAIATIGSLLMITTKKLERRVVVGIGLLFAAFVIQAIVICYDRWGLSGIAWLVVLEVVGGGGIVCWLLYRK